MTRGDTSDRIERTTEILSTTSLEHRELVRELQIIVRDTNEKKRERPTIARPSLTLECTTGHREVVLHSRNRNERKATVTCSDSEKMHFVLDSGRATWRIPHNVIRLRENEL